jgi:hypothetical protein
MRVLVALALLGLAVPSAAGVRCPTVTDPAGDASWNGAAPDSSGDLLSVRVGSDGRSLTAVLRLAALDDAALRPVGHMYEVYLYDGEASRVLQAQLDGLQPAFTLRAGGRPPGETGAYPAGTVISAASGSVDAVRHDVRMRVPLSRLGWGTGRRVEVSAVSWESLGLRGAGPVPRDSLIASSDFTDDIATYRIGSPGCR